MNKSFYLCYIKLTNTQKHTVMTTQNIQATDFSMETNIISLNFVPTVNEQNELFGNDDSIILEF